MTTRDFRTLEVWRRSHEFALKVYRVTSKFPAHEQFGLTNQMRRAAVSVPTNIAEGCGRGGDAELARFLTISQGSASELEYQVVLTRELGYLSNGDEQELLAEVVQLQRMLSAFISTIRKRRG